MSDAILRLTGVTITYNENTPTAVQVLHGIDLTIQPGEVVALVAPSGAGKSTLLHIAGLLESPSEGRVEICGEDLSAAKDRQRTEARRDSIGFIYQFHRLLPEFSAAENIAMPQRAAGIKADEALKRAAQLLETVGLDHRGNHRPAELSGGEQQRVAFCRALANSPRLLLADEPTGNLDPETSDTVFEVLMKLVRDTGLAALIATHNHELAARMDRVIRLKAGQVE